MKDSFIEKAASDINILSFLINSIEQDRFVKLGRDVPSFRDYVFKGYSVKKENFEHIRSRIISWHRNDKRRIKVLLEIWAEEKAELIEFFKVVKLEYLSKNKYFFIKKLSPEFFMALTAVMGEEIFSKEDLSIKSDDKSNSADGPPLPLFPFVTIISETSDHRENFTTENEIKKTNTPAEKSNLKDSKIINRLSHKLTERENEIIQLNTSLKGLQRENSEIKKRQRYLEDEIETLRQNMDKEISKKEYEFRKKLKMEFENPAMKIKYSKTTGDNSQLTDFAQKAIALQAQKNVRYGTIKQLRDNFKLITELINELRAAKNESVYLVPEIDTALNKLKQQREHLLQDETFAEILLCKNNNKLYLEKNIIDELANTKESLPILEKMHENIIELKGELLLGEEGFNEICASINKKLALIIIHSENSYNKDENRATDGTLEDIIKKGLAAKIDLVIDGNNILLRNLHRNNALVEFSSLSEARNDFNSKVKSKASIFKNIYIVYDGVEDKEIPSGNCRIVFTNKSETIADDKIYSMIASYKEGTVILATADEGLISKNPNALILGAKHCYEFFLS